ncbi:hypothetical protein ACMFMG_012003 [Clarireedia jacksonii]
MMTVGQHRLKLKDLLIYYCLSLSVVDIYQRVAVEVNISYDMTTPTQRKLRSSFILNKPNLVPSKNVLDKIVEEEDEWDEEDEKDRVYYGSEEEDVDEEEEEDMDDEEEEDVDEEEDDESDSDNEYEEDFVDDRSEDSEDSDGTFLQSSLSSDNDDSEEEEGSRSEDETTSLVHELENLGM